MPLARAKTPFVFTGLPRETYHGLPAMLADALPDAFGNSLINAWMAKRGIPPQSISPLDRLAYMGRRGMGALAFKPARGAMAESSTPLKMKGLVEAARRAVAGDLSDDSHAKAALSNIIRVGTSAGGARAKAVVAWNPETDELRSGQFDVAPGFEHWLLKFDGVGKDGDLGEAEGYGRIEYAYHRMAAAAGVVMSPCRLMAENGRAHFMTRRFDRDGNRRIHVQTLCAMQHMDYKQRATHAYESLFMTAKALQLGDVAGIQLFLRMAFNVAARNCGGHSKNFAFMLQEGGRWELAPAYDITHAYNPQSYWVAQHLMSINGKFQGAARQDLMVLASRFNIPAVSMLLEQVNAAVAQWDRFADEAGVSAPDRARVAKDFRVL
jgi:serine/threonine-protein kinase HipA